MTSKKLKPSVWIGADGAFLGSTGTNSVEDFARAILAEGDRDMLDLLDEYGVDERLDEYPDAEHLGLIAARLTELGAYACKVPVRQWGKESWSDVYEIAMHERPGRGYIKVVGVLV
jgi:hypothetical protein